MKSFKTEQEKFWAEEFGDGYIQRNNDPDIIRQNTYLFSKIFSRTGKVASMIEFGANIGLNLRAIKTLMPDIQMTAVEINPEAVRELRKIEGADVRHESILEFKIDKQRELSLIKTVLIHINPEMLKDVYTLLYNSSSKYVCVAEFYNPSPVSVPYRGHQDRLFKRDFAGEMMDMFGDLKLVDYGFCYHRDECLPKTDVTWFLMEKGK
jgi:spore coat polysaccharide biosynthesis protein SpsF